LFLNIGHIVFSFGFGWFSGFMFHYWKNVGLVLVGQICSRTLTEFYDPYNCWSGNFSVTNWRTPWNWALLEKLPVAQLLNNFPTSYGTAKFHKSPSLVPILSQINPVHTAPSYLKIHLNIRPPLHLTFLDSASHGHTSQEFWIVDWVTCCHTKTVKWMACRMSILIWIPFPMSIKHTALCTNCFLYTCLKPLIIPKSRGCMTLMQFGGWNTHLYIPERECVWRLSGTIIYKEEDFPA
jgi:hypothetical protein